MSADSPITTLLAKTKSNDNDVKTDAIAKLQLQLEGGTEIPDVEALTATLKACLRISNQHLATATLSTIQAFTHRITTESSTSASASATPLSNSAEQTVATLDSHRVHELRHALLAFLPSGGVIDRLGEPRETARTIARDTLVTLGTAAYKSSGPVPASTLRQKDHKAETPFATFDKFLKEVGFGSKVWRVREQIILTLVALRRLHPQFPIRPFLTPLVEALEDSDGSVRDCARQSVITLFSGRAASDGARADLKNEMSKKGVRKGIVDGILTGLLSGGSASASGSLVDYSGSESGGAKVGVKNSGDAVEKVTPGGPGSRPPTSGNSRVHARTVSRELPRSNSRAAMVDEVLPPANVPTVIAPVFIASSRDLETEFSRMMPPFEGKETEQNWALREQAILRIRGMIQADAHVRYQEAFIAGLKSGILERTFKALASLRTTVSANTCLLYSDLAVGLGPLLDPFVDMLLLQLLRMAGFTKKIAAQQSQASVTSVISNTSCQPRIIIPHLSSFMQEKTVQARQFVLGHLYVFLETHAERSKGIIEAHGGFDMLDKLLRKGLTDPNPGVKSKAREAYWIFHSVWPAHALIIMDSLDAAGRKQLEKANPDPGALPSAVETEAKTPAKKTSVAAAIAASRAKAKVIATAPPTLRHAATSGATAANKASSPAQTMGRSSNGRMSTSSSTVFRRSISPASPNPFSSPSRSTSATSLGVASGSLYKRTASTSPSPPSSPIAELALRRRTMSPLVANKSTSTSNSSSSRSPPPAVPRAISPPNFLHSGPSSPLSRSNGHATARGSHSQVHSNANVPRESLDLHAGEADDSLLMAIQNPLPQDSDSEDGSFRPDFASPTTKPLQQLSSISPPRSPSSAKTLFPHDSISQTASQVFTPRSFPQQEQEQESLPSHELVEDALRAAAEQAESSAERLSELMEPDHLHVSPIPPSLILSGSEPVESTTSSRRSASGTASSTTARIPSTPMSRPSKDMLKGLELFQNSPALKGSPSVMDRLYENKHQTGWWLKRKSLLDAGTPLKPEYESHSHELRTHVKALQDGTANVRTLQKLTLLCNANPALPTDSLSPVMRTLHSSPLPARGPAGMLQGDIWQGGRLFDTLIKPLMQFIRNTKDEELIEYGLCVMWEMVENQPSYLDEAEVFSLLFHVRYANTYPILEATSTVRDALVSRQEPVYGLKTLHACLSEFLSQPVPKCVSGSPDTAHIRTSSHAFGIIGLGKLIMRLPAEILEDELPLLKTTLTSVLDEKDPSRTTIREAAYASIVAAQAVLRDETHLFKLLDGLELSKKNLLTYYFDKHGARGVVEGATAVAMPKKLSVDANVGQAEEKVVKELLRLDAKISTPVK